MENNRRWVRDREQRDPGYFARLSRQQAPEYLWIGCADSRVPANQIVGLDPGELFVHRNVANLVSPSDLNCLSVLQFAVDVLQVRHVIVCGHHGCGGVRAAMHDEQFGLSDQWLWPLRALRREHAQELAGFADEDERVDRLCELSVRAQVVAAASTSIVQNAWHRGQPLAVHGWVYCLSDGLVRDLDTRLDGPDGVPEAFRLSAARR